MSGKGFEELEVWQLSRQLASDVYKIVSLFEKSDLFTLGDQIRRSAISIPSNIAEGAARGSDKDFIRFIRISLGSCAELRTQIYIGKDNNLITPKIFDDLDKRIDQIGRMLKGLERGVANKKQLMTSNQ